MIPALRFVVPAVAFTPLFACSHENREPRSSTVTTVTAAPAAVGNNNAVARVADARCAREARCDNVGADKKYTSTEACGQKLRADMKDDLNAKDCPGGVSQKDLDACLSAIKAETCGNVLDSIERVAACRTSALCVN